MNINLERFTQPQQVIMPLVDGWGRVGARRINLSVPTDGWYVVELGSSPQALRPATLLEISQLLDQKKMYRVYPVGREGIPLSFDIFARKGLSEAVEVNFLNLPIFSVAKIIEWSDKRFYCVEEDESYAFAPPLQAVKKAFHEETPLPTKGVTPELRYYFLVLTLQRQGYRQAQELEKMKLSQAEREKRIREFESTFAGRLQQSIEQAGGHLVKFHKANGTSWLVHWKLGNQVIKSTLHDDLRIINAGFCLSGDDRKHTMSSLVVLAQMFEEHAPLYITRD